MILDGTKISSLRLFDDKNFQAGDMLTLINWDTGETFAEAIVTEVIAKPLGDITEDDLRGHEAFKSKEDMYARLGKYYHDVNQSTSAKIVRFRVTHKEP